MQFDGGSVVELILLVAVMLGVGLFAGFIGGLFGIGGGVVIVPALYTAFGLQGVDDMVRIKLAVGTSLATIIITSWRSVRTHLSHGMVDVDLLKSWAPWIAGGAAFGALAARHADAQFLSVFFALGIIVLALQKIFFPPKEHKEKAALAPVPKGGVPVLVGGGVGLASSLMGIGGGVLGVIILTGYGRTIHQAIATAAGFGLAIAVPGAAGFVLAGLGAVGLPAFSLGFVYLPAFAGIAMMTALTAPIGARFAHQLDKTWLNRIFAAYMLITGVLLLGDVLAG